ncbi:hypothetical protein MKW94_026283 [Papaver nudicaule]|uniref:Beta-catenin-like protein 1 N-terminal domain-containing protein n=1 Tax=Papaver nudicaule TaxID=74823 RepID=A0AA41SL45_PAPNU|nr:hypothetical protein [Papaver nudicaule]
MGTPISDADPVPKVPYCYPDLGFNSKVLEPDSPDELESSFQQSLEVYNQAIKKIPVFQHIISDLDLQAFKSMIDLLETTTVFEEYLAGYILLTFKELTAVNKFLDDHEDKATAKFVDMLLGCRAIEVFGSMVDKFTIDGVPHQTFDDHEGAVAFRALQTISHMMFINPDVAELVCNQTKLVKWVIGKLEKGDAFDFAKHNVVGFLSTLLQPPWTTSSKLGELGAVEAVVKALLPYTTVEEEEDEDEEDILLVEEQYLLENLFQCLSGLLWFSENRKRFAVAGGGGYMIKIVEQKKLNDAYYGSAIVALDDALKDCPCASDKFVGASGLDIAFPASIISTCETHDKEEIEERLISIIASLTGGIATETDKDKLLRKFEENDFRKTTWLMKLFRRYFENVAAMRKVPKLDESDLYEVKMRYGLPTLQSIAVILGYLWLSNKSEIIARIENELSRHNLKKTDVREILIEYIKGGSVKQIPAKAAVIQKYIDFLEVIIISPCSRRR